MTRILSTATLSFLLLLSPGCDSKGPDATSSPSREPANAPPAEPAEAARISTSLGEMVMEFWPETAPRTVAHFKKLARAGFYDGTAFHRVVHGQLIQGGDPLTRDPDAVDRWGTGGSETTIAAEPSSRFHRRGVVSLAHLPDQPDSGRSQFFICLTNLPSLNATYTPFGAILRGEEVLRAIGAADVVQEPIPDLPRTRINIDSVRIIPLSTVN